MIIDQLPSANPNLTDETVTEQGTNLFKTTWQKIRDLFFGSSASFASDVTVHGVLDVVQRRCSASLSSPGWYRAFKIEGGLGRAATSFSIGINIGRAFNSTNTEYHAITLLADYYTFAFANESSKSIAQGITKVRYSLDSSGNGYIDIYYSLSVQNTIYLRFDVNCMPGLEYRFNADALQNVAPSPSGETEEASFNFAINTDYARTGFSPTFAGTANPSVSNMLCAYSVKNGVLYFGGRINLTSFTSGAKTVTFTLPVSLGGTDRGAETIGIMFTTNKILQLRWDGSVVYVTDAGGNYSGTILSTGYWSIQITAPIYN